MHLTERKESNQDLPDIEIASRIAAGDMVMLQQLMRHYNQRLYRTARSILKDDAEAEDAVQEAYVLAYHGMSKFRGDAKLSTWLIRILVNEALGRLRKRSRRAEVISLNGDLDLVEQSCKVSEGDMNSHLPEHAVLQAQMRSLIENKINQLPDVFRTVFMLRGVEEMAVNEVAVCLGIPEATVRTRYFRARSLLREALACEIDFSLENAFSFAGDRCNRIVAKVLKRLET